MDSHTAQYVYWEKYYLIIMSSFSQTVIFKPFRMNHLQLYLISRFVCIVMVLATVWIWFLSIRLTLQSLWGFAVEHCLISTGKFVTQSRHIWAPTMPLFVEESDMPAAASEESLFVLPGINGGHNGPATTLCAQS